MSRVDVLNRVVTGGYIASAHALALFRLFLLAGVIIGNLKRDREFVIIDTTISYLA